MRISISILFSILVINLSGCGGGGGSSSTSTTTTTTTTTTYTYTVTTFAGTGSSGFVNGTGTAASFNAPDSLVSDTSSNIFVVDTTNNAIRKITSSQIVTTFATLTTGSGIAIDSSGNLFVSSGGLIKKITSAGADSTFAGSTTTGNTDGTGTAAAFSSIWGMTVDSSNNLYVADAGNHNIRKITSSGVVTTFAGSTAGTSGSTNGTGTAATFNKPASLAFDSSGNLFVTEFGNHMIRKITSTGVVTTFAGSTTSGSTDGTGIAASFWKPLGIVIDTTDSIYVVDQNNNMVRKVTSAGVVTTIIGTTTSGNTNGVGTSALLKTPNGIAKDSSGSLYISDYGNNLIRKVTITTTTTTN